MLNYPRYWLKNAHIPTCLLDYPQTSTTREGLSLVNLEILDGTIHQITTQEIEDHRVIDLAKGIVLPCFVDVHTHLDKGHIWERTPNLEGTFDNALTLVKTDAQKHWDAQDLYHRMEFGLKCAYAHGTKAIRTHLDCFGEQAKISLDVFKTLQKKWLNKIALQAVCLVTLDYFQQPEGIALADQIAEIGGILGGVAYMNPQLDSQLDQIFLLAKQRGLDLDFHADENGEPDSICLQKIAEAAIRHNFPGKILCGHCCSLAVQPEATAENIITKVKEANISIVSLPMCNLYLQDRKEAKTPFWRGVTRVKELNEQSVSVAFASDNCRDPFYGFGDHDVLEVFTQAVRIAHLDTPYSDWISSVTKTPANLMGLPQEGKIALGLPADMIIFKGRYFSELLSRPQSDRLVLRSGQQIDTTLPHYAELDHITS